MFNAILVDQPGSAAKIVRLGESELPEASVTVDVAWSTINYKDGLALTGKSPILRKFPIVPGIDLAGVVTASSHPAWKPGDRVVFGASDDGGYYLIGLKQAHAAPFERITWSTGSVYAETVERVHETGIELVELPVWYDVDDAATLAVLEAELLDGRRPAFASVDGYAATATREWLMTRGGR